ncbi:MAG TPA: hypothetical protein VIW47_09005, partial [Nitrospiraceae bacterium]
RAGRSPKDDGGELIRFDRPSQWPIWGSNVLLPDEVPKVSRPKSLGQRSLNGFASLWSTKQIGTLIV